MDRILSCILCVTLQEHAQLAVAGAYALAGKEECSFTTQQMHQGRSSISNLVINGIAAGGALVTYNGAINIQKSAAKSIARQENKTLLIGSQAKAISIPSLEVQTNDVQCAHGSAVGPLQEDQLTYAQSRGLSLHSAQRLLVTSFFAQALEGMLDENLREKIVAQLVDKAMGEKRNRMKNNILPFGSMEAAGRMETSPLTPLGFYRGERIA